MNCNNCGLKHESDCFAALKAEVVRLQNIIVNVNNILFDLHHHVEDVEHTIKCHPETVNQHFCAVAEGVNVVLDILNKDACKIIFSKWMCVQ